VPAPRASVAVPPAPLNLTNMRQFLTTPVPKVVPRSSAHLMHSMHAAPTDVPARPLLRAECSTDLSQANGVVQCYIRRNKNGATP